MDKPNIFRSRSTDSVCVMAYRGRRGFTLVELLVVIAIISLLVSILLPSLSRAKGLAQRVACMSNLKGLGLTMSMYLQDNNQQLMPAYTNMRGKPWYRYLDEFDDDVWQADGNHMLRCPSDDSAKMHYEHVTYRANFSFFRWVQWDHSPPYNVPYSYIESPSSAIGFVEGTADPVSLWIVWMQDIHALDPTLGVQEYHSEGANYLWMDWHVSWESDIPLPGDGFWTN